MPVHVPATAGTDGQVALTGRLAPLCNISSSQEGS
jgi:hypothetical protein